MRKRGAGTQAQERRWYVRVGDHVDGPHAESRIKQWLREGKLPADLMLSTDCRKWRQVKIGRSLRPRGG